MSEDWRKLGKSLRQLVKMAVAIPPSATLYAIGDVCWKAHFRLERWGDAILNWGFKHRSGWHK